MKETKSKTIDFAYNVTALEALRMGAKYHWVFAVKVALAVNRAAHRLPWLFVLLAVAATTVVSFACIGRARAERDRYNQKNVHLQQQLDSYRAVYGDGKEAN